MKSKTFLLLSLILIFVSVIALRQYQPVTSGTSTVPFTISKGQGLDRVGQNLKSAGLIRSVPAFKFEVMRQGVSKKIQAGDFNLSSSMSLSTIVSSLTRGRSDISIKILEGWRREQIAWQASQILGDSFDTDRFLKLTATLEGKLYPDTYSLSKSTTPESLIVTLTDNFSKKTQDLNVDSRSLDRAVIMASLIEREALTDTEKPIIAGILKNRMDKGWPLQIDATIQYQKATTVCAKKLNCDWWPQNISRDDIGRPSSYNTYLNQGLPAGPIANPSITSIKAALNPQPTSYWFYLHDMSGQIHYATTIEGHNENIAKYLNK
jgi:UPF0755 protein